MLPPPIDHGVGAYFAVAHMHNVLIGGSVFAGFADLAFFPS
jgi:heme/copper-type cytochrome/quinol oxidase subunit 1